MSSLVCSSWHMLHQGTIAKKWQKLNIARNFCDIKPPYHYPGVYKQANSIFLLRKLYWWRPATPTSCQEQKKIMFYAIGYYCWEIASSFWNSHHFSSGQDIRNNNASFERYWNAEFNNVWMIVLALSSAEQYIFNWRHPDKFPTKSTVGFELWQNLWNSTYYNVWYITGKALSCWN